MGQPVGVTTRSARRRVGIATAHHMRFVERQICDLAATPCRGPLLLDALYGDSLVGLLPARLTTLLTIPHAI